MQGHAFLSEAGVTALHLATIVISLEGITEFMMNGA